MSGLELVTERRSGPVLVEHNFGPVLAEGQTLTHEYVLQNPLDVPLNLGRPELSTPCCTTVAAAPVVIAAHGSARMSVSFRPGLQSGSKRVGCVIPTDSSQLPAFDLRVNATLFGAVEIRAGEGSQSSLATGRPGIKKFTVISRSTASSGRGIPDQLATSGAITARFVGPTASRTNADAIREVSRDLEVTLAALPHAGTQRGEVRLVWPDGQDWVIPVAWEVRPLVEVSPRGLILQPDAGSEELTVVVRASDQPIQILSVQGAKLASPLGSEAVKPQRTQTVHLLFDSRHAAPGATDIIIRTDHPTQPEVTVSVLVSPGPHKERP